VRLASFKILLQEQHVLFAYQVLLPLRMQAVLAMHARLAQQV
tara:strand:- start:237 stop:362 length:126 start_codon:yes stop_codon:yes gene_type:complete